MKVEQAIYGVGSDGHGLREASQRSPLFNELESRLDLPDTPPPGVEWSPFLRGFPFGQHYILARTFADPTASRTGFVLTHAVVAPLREIAALKDLRPLVALLIQQPQSSLRLESRDVAVSDESPPNASDLVSTAEALTTLGTGPVVRIGTEDFDELVCALWFRFWPELRATFAFRLSFGPSDWRDKDTPSLVCSPQSLSSRWSGHRVVGQAAAARSSTAGTILSGGETAESVISFAREIGARLDELANVPMLQRVYDLWFAPEPSLDDCVSMLRLTERLSPDPATGDVIKQELVKRIETRLANATAEEVHRLRNLRTAGFSTRSALWAALTTWMANNEYARSQDTALLLILADATSDSVAVKDWRDAILLGINAAAKSGTSSFAQAFWRWAESSSAILADVAVHLPNLQDLETLLVEAAPRETKREAGAVVRAVSVSKRWWHLHGAAVGATLPPTEALRSQLAVDASATTPKAIKAALRRASPEQVIALALEVDESGVSDVAAELVAGKPYLLRDITLSSSSAQTVWARAVVINSEAWSGPDNPGKKFADILQGLVDGRSISEQVIDILATTPLADLGACPRRAEIWALVSGPARELLLEATAKGWLTRALANQVVEEVETPLENALLTNTSLEMDLRAAAATKPRAVIRVVQALPRFDESRFNSCLESFYTGRVRLTAMESDALGDLIHRRRWQRSVDRLLQLARAGHDEVKPVLRICEEMISWLNKWSLGISLPSPEASWRVLEELASELYSSGPDHEELWSRAGGKPADLQRNGSGQARWHDALAQIKRGRKPGINKLIDEMAHDFPNNEHLRRLKSDQSFHDISNQKQEKRL